MTEPVWDGWGACYPPKSAWVPIQPGEVRRAWSRALADETLPRERRRIGLYVHVPGEPTPAYPSLLAEEIRALGLPSGTAMDTLFIGSSGSGGLCALSPPRLEELLSLLERHFDLTRSRQSTAELRADGLAAESVAALRRHDIRRITVPIHEPPPGTKRAGWERSLAKGCLLIRKGGLDLDLDLAVAGWEWRDPDLCLRLLLFAQELGPASVDVDEPRFPEWTDPRLRERVHRAVRTLRQRSDPRRKNLQLLHSAGHRSHVLGLGFGAVSHLADRLQYEMDGGFEAYTGELECGRPPLLRGCRLSRNLEMRARIMGCLASGEPIWRSRFRACFGEYPEAAFAGTFRRLMDAGRIRRTRTALQAVSCQAGQESAAAFRI
ncbi:MAG: hypothetical protein WC728_12825 [Elusimicrobiota bacterium]